MRAYRDHILELALCLILCASQRVQSADVPVLLAEYDSLYNHVIVLRMGDIVFFKRMENGHFVSAIDLANPARQLIPYTQTLFAPAFFKPDPNHVLNVGLGAGAINRLFTTIYPSSTLVSVEIDSMIVNAAERHTGYSESLNDVTVIRDGRVFLRQESQQWDWIILDAFVRRSQIPPHLTTLEFYELVKRRLTDDGVMAANLHSGTRLFDSQVVTLKAVFPQVLFFRVPTRTNIIALGVKYSQPELHSVLRETDLRSMPDLSAYDVYFGNIREAEVRSQDPLLNRPGQLLTDDFAPVEFLDLQMSTDE